MSEMMQSGIAVFLGLITFGVCYYRFLIKGKSGKERFIDRAKQKGCVTEGTCIKTKTRFGTHDSNDASYLSNDSIIVKYEYMVKGKSYSKKIKFQSPGMVSIKYPYKVNIYYDEKNPAKAYCREEASADSGCLLTLVCTGAVIFVVSHLLQALGQ